MAARRGPLTEPAIGLTQSFELVRRAQGGDGQAVERLIARYYERVRPIVRARLGPALRTRLDSADILQETFLAAVRMFDRFELQSEAGLIQWLAKIAELRVREAAQKMNAAKRDPAREKRFERPLSTGTVFAEPAAEAPSPSMEAAAGEEREAFERCLELLPEDYREVILLRDYSGASWEEVAQALEKPSAGAARMLHSRAMAELASVFRRSG